MNRLEALRHKELTLLQRQKKICVYCGKHLTNHIIVLRGSRLYNEIQLKLNVYQTVLSKIS